MTDEPASPRHVLTAPRRLSPSDRLEGFDSGKPALDDWLKKYAHLSEGRSARTYVVSRGEEVVGYYCIASSSVERGALPKAMKREQGQPRILPVAIIGRLARDRRYRGTGLGQDLLRDALLRIISASETIGVRAILVHALDEEAAVFWKAAEFEECPIGSRTFYLSIKTAIDALAE